jgi:putative ABC transport system permease protein
MRPLLARLLALVGRGRLDDELSDEIAAHLELAIADHVAKGMSPEDARRAAAHKFGSALDTKEAYRARQGFPRLESLWRDVRHGARWLRKSRGVTTIVVGTVAIGIGLNTAVFSFINAMLLRSLPFPDADRLVAVWFTPAERPTLKTGTNPLGYFTIRDANHVFERVGAGRLTAAFNVGEDLPGGGGRIRVPAQWFTFDLIPVLGVSPAIGRWPTPDEQDVVVISDGLWHRLFGGSADVLGKKLRFDAFVGTIVGVTPAGFELVNPADFWLFQTDEALRGSLRSPSRIFSVVARLKPGVTVGRAQAEMTSLAAVLVDQMPDMNRGWSIHVETLQDVYVGEIREPLLVFQGAVFLVLLIACANAAGLLLAEASTRHGELTLRVALGASRWHIVRQLLTESLLLAVAGGALGLTLSWAGLRLFTHVPWQGMPAPAVVTLDSTVLGVALLMTIGSGMAFGVVPALSVSRSNAMATLRESTRSATTSAARQTLRSAFVVVQVSLALVLLVGAGLMIKSFLRLGTVQAGFDTVRLITFQVPFPRSFYTWDGNTSFVVELGSRIDRVSESIRERLAQVPGVESAALTVTPPLGGDPPRMSFMPEGRQLSPFERQAWSAEWYPVGFTYFRTLKIPLVAGRQFVEDDGDNGRAVAIVNATLANTFWPGERPIGQRIQLNLPHDPPREIVGVVGDVRQDRYQHSAAPQLYVPRVQLPRHMDMTLSQQIMLVNTFIARVGVDPAQLTPALRSAVADVDPTQVVTNLRTVDQYAAGQLNNLRAYTVVLSLFGGASVILAVIGIYGILTHFVSQRRREIGIRMALGARPAMVLRLVVRQGMLMMVTGITLGTVAALGLTRVLRSLLWGVTPTDPMTFGLVLLAFAVVGLLACAAPAWRASRIDPLIALRD